MAGMPHHAEQHVGELAEHVLADDVALELADRAADRVGLVDRHGEVVAPEDHQPLDEADLDRHLLVDARVDLAPAKRLGALETALAFEAGLRRRRKRGIVDQRDAGRRELGLEGGLGIRGDTGDSAGLRAEAKALEDERGLLRLRDGQRHPPSPVSIPATGTL